MLAEVKTLWGVRVGDASARKPGFESCVGFDGLSGCGRVVAWIAHLVE